MFLWHISFIARISWEEGRKEGRKRQISLFLWTGWGTISVRIFSTRNVKTISPFQMKTWFLFVHTTNVDNKYPQGDFFQRRSEVKRRENTKRYLLNSSILLLKEKTYYVSASRKTSRITILPESSICRCYTQFGWNFHQPTWVHYA